MAARLFIPWFRLGPWTLQPPFLPWEVTIDPFSAFSLGALGVGLIVASLFAERYGRSLDLTLELGIYLIAFSFPTGYLLNGLLYQPERFFYLLRHPSAFGEVHLGLSMYGGIVGTLLGAWVWKWRTKASILEIGDSFAFGGPCGWTLARAGCFVTHDHPGRESDFFLAVADFRTGAPPYVARHDMGLYDMIVLGAIAVTFLFLGRTRRPAGFYVGLLPLLYAPSRFLLDFLRAPASEGGDIRYAGLTPAQYGSMLLLLSGIAVMQRIGGTGRAT
ncbi:MAG: prolipoprotein diacylglyceryl transferase family protein [Polyangiales bacterium]